MEELLIDKLLTEYLDKIYFYSIKRTSCVNDAEDLSQTILMEIIINFKKGIIPENFDYYVWKIVKNQYAKFIKYRVKERKNLINEYDLDRLPINQTNAFDDFVLKEQSESVRCAVKLLSKDYLNILVAYYIDDLSIKEISKNTNLPEGTVKYKLYSLRQKLKEVIKMNQLNGKKTYSPEDLSPLFHVDKEGTEGSPWNLFSNLIQKNILLHAYKNPSSLKDFALELGISMPYIEEIVYQLKLGTVLKEVERNKYVTNFTIVSKKEQKDLRDYITREKESIGKDVFDWLDDVIEDVRKIDFVGSDLPKEYLYWQLLELIWVLLEDEVCDFKISERPFGGKWDVIAYENREYDPELFFVGLNGHFDSKRSVFYLEHDITHPELRGRRITLLEDDLIDVLRMICKTPKGELVVEDVLKKFDKSIKRLCEKNLIKVIENKIKVNTVYLQDGEREKIYETISKSPKLDKVINHYTLFKKWIIESIAVGDNVEHVAISMLGWFRSSIILYGIKHQYLSLDKESEVFAYSVLFEEMSTSINFK